MLSRLHVTTILVISFVTAILTGAFLLMLPMASRGHGLSFLDALFTSASAVCVTGLTVVDTGSYMTFFGQTVVLVLIQLGGLGVMTVSLMIFQILGKNISFRQRMVMQEVYTHTPRKDILKIVNKVILFTFISEAIGIVSLFLYWSSRFPWEKALYYACFHSVSAFCNAGFSLFSDSLTMDQAAWFPNLVFCFLIIAGGIGFPVLYEIHLHIVSRSKRKKRFSVQTKTVLWTSAVLTFAGALFFFVLEYNSILEKFPLSTKILISLFQSVTARTAGFNTIDIGTLNDSTLFFMLFLMFFGASPGSCGGGVKTTTLALIAAFVKGRLSHHKRVNLFKKSIPNSTVTRSLSLLLLSFSTILLILFIIIVGESILQGGMIIHQKGFLAYLFETVSAFGTVGLSTGITSSLTYWGKFWIIVMMLIGRVGVLTFTYVFVGKEPDRGIEYSEENVMIG